MNLKKVFGMWYLPGRNVLWMAMMMTIAMNCLICAGLMIDFSIDDPTRKYYGIMLGIWLMVGNPFFWGIITQESCDRWCKKPIRT